uniref:STAS domain-containing protein n=1 Tax=Haemonchus contortus TaxID=6289 RepID=A0A7I4YD14_HAECO
MDSVSLLGPPAQPKAVNQDEFDSRFNFIRYKKKKTNREVLLRLIADNLHSYKSAKDLLPFLSWIRNYDMRAKAVRDLFGSFLIAAILIPQGLMNGFLSSDIPAGLLAILLPHAVYPFFGSARHCSLGAFSIASFLVYSSMHHSGSSVATLTLGCGLFQMIHFAFPLDFVLSFVPTNLLLGFNLGVTIRIFLHLWPTIMNFRTEQCSKILNGFCVDSISACVFSMDYGPLLIFAVSLVILFVFKWKLNTKLSESIGTTIPHEMIILLIATLASYFIGLSDAALLQVKAESIIPSVVQPSVPNAFVIVDAFAIFLFIVVSHMKAICRREQQPVNKKQELFCMSIISLLSGPFGILPVTSSMNDNQIELETRNYSLISNLLSALWMTITLYFARSIFGLIPSSVVAAMILSAVCDVCLNLRHLRVLCSSYICDAVIFVSALLSALFIPNLCLAFLVAVTIGLLSIVIRTQRPKCDVVVRATENCYIEENRYECEGLDAPLRILRITSPLIFANCEVVREEISKQAAAVKGLFETGIESRTPSMRSQPLMAVNECVSGRASLIIITHDSDPDPLQMNPSDSPTFKCIVLDCSGVAYVDPEAVKMLSQVYTELRDDSIRLLFAGVNANIRDFLEITNFYALVPRSLFFPTLQDALSSLRNTNFPFHMSVSMNGYRDVVTLSTAPSHLDISCNSPEPV